MTTTRSRPGRPPRVVWDDNGVAVVTVKGTTFKFSPSGRLVGAGSTELRAHPEYGYARKLVGDALVGPD